MVAVLLVICRRTACSRLALVHRCRYAQLTVSTNEYHTATFEQILVSKETILSAGSVVVALSQQMEFEQNRHPKDGHGIFVIL